MCLCLPDNVEPGEHDDLQEIVVNQVTMGPPLGKENFSPTLFLACSMADNLDTVFIPT